MHFGGIFLCVSAAPLRTDALTKPTGLDPRAALLVRTHRVTVRLQFAQASAGIKEAWREEPGQQGALSLWTAGPARAPLPGGGGWGFVLRCWTCL